MEDVFKFGDFLKNMGESKIKPKSARKLLEDENIEKSIVDESIPNPPVEIEPSIEKEEETEKIIEPEVIEPEEGVEVEEPILFSEPEVSEVSEDEQPDGSIADCNLCKDKFYERDLRNGICDDCNFLLKDESKIVSEPIIEKEEDDDSISEEKMFESMLQNQTPTFYDFRQDYIQPQPVEEEPIQYQHSVQPKYEEVEEEEEVMVFEESSDDDEYYKLYSDKAEDFICDIAIEGANPKETEARIVIESDDWTLLFYGELKSGKCIVPMRKLNILQEGQIGNIRLEVIAEGNLFIPWEDKFKVKLSKKVTVKVNENKKQPIKQKFATNVKVNVKR